jgi:DNA-binding NarL/FixJ family response regulator
MRRKDMGSYGFGRPSILTARERQVAVLAHCGLSNKLVAKKLNVSEGTVKQHLHSIFLKLNIRSRSALIIRKLPRDGDWLDDQREICRINQSVVNTLWASTDFGKS